MNNVTNAGYAGRMILYAAIAFLTPLSAVLAAGKPIGPAEWVGATIAALIAVRAYVDRSGARLNSDRDDTEAPPTVRITHGPIVPIVPPTP